MKKVIKLGLTDEEWELVIKSLDFCANHHWHKSNALLEKITKRYAKAKKVRDSYVLNPETGVKERI